MTETYGAVWTDVHADARPAGTGAPRNGSTTPPPALPAFDGPDDPRRALVREMVGHHARQLRNLTDDLDRLSASTATTTALIADLAASLDLEFERLRAESTAWVEGSSAPDDA